MRKKQKKQDNKNIKLGLYFGFVVFLIILTSVIFKVLDVVRNSKYDGQNHFNVIILNQDNAEVFSFSPKEKKLNYLTLGNLGKLDLIENTDIPIDGVIKTSNRTTGNTKNNFIKILFNLHKYDTNLSIIDIVRLSLLSQSIDKEKSESANVSINDKNYLSELSASLFIDDVMLNENKKIQVTNSTQVQGLGNLVAKQITNNGGNVVLVNTSQNPTDKSIIYYTQDSYTLRRLAKRYNLPMEKKEANTIAEIVIILGKDIQ